MWDKICDEVDIICARLSELEAESKEDKDV